MPEWPGDGGREAVLTRDGRWAQTRTCRRYPSLASSSCRLCGTVVVHRVLHASIAALLVPGLPPVLCLNADRPLQVSVRAWACRQLADDGGPAVLLARHASDNRAPS